EDDAFCFTDAVSEDRGKDDTEWQERDGGHNLCQTHEEVIHLAALVAGDTAHQDADDGGDNNGDGADGHRHAAAREQAAEQIAAEVIGAHEVAVKAPGSDIAVLVNAIIR